MHKTAEHADGYHDQDEVRQDNSGDLPLLRSLSGSGARMAPGSISFGD
jgi:hypothetical protein